MQEDLEKLGMTLAGGAIVRALHKEPPGVYDYWGSWESVIAAAEMLDRAGWIKKPGHINPTFVSPKEKQVIQLCLKFLGPVRETISKFDLSCCALFIKDGEVHEAIAGAAMDCFYKRFKIMNRGITTRSRVEKYVGRGFKITGGEEHLKGPVTVGMVGMISG